MEEGGWNQPQNKHQVDLKVHSKHDRGLKRFILIILYLDISIYKRAANCN